MLGRFLVLWGSLVLAIATAACGGSVSGGGSGGSAGSGSGGAGGSGGGSGGAGGGGGAGFQLTCFNQGVTYPPASKACVADADCGQILHVVDCCGSLAAIGLDADDLAAVSMAEQQCGMQAICDCVAKPTTTEDGKTVMDPSMIGVGCVMGACSTKALP